MHARIRKIGYGCVAILMPLLAVLSYPLSESEGAGFATAGVGIKARSMGGAFRGVADDWSAISYNPAGLAFLKRNMLDVTLGTYSPQLGYTPNISGNGIDIGFAHANGLKSYPLEDVWPIPSFAAVAAPTESRPFAFGAAVMFPHDVNYAWDLYRPPVGYDTDFRFSTEKYRTDMDVLDIQPTVAKAFGKKLSVGAGLAVTRGDVVFRRIILVPNPLGSPFNVYPYNNFIGALHLDGNGWSIGGNFGVMWRPREGVSIGLSAQAPVTAPLKGKADLTMAWPRNASLANLELWGYLRDKTFYHGNTDEVNGRASYASSDYELNLHLPGQIGAGVGWTATDRLTLAADVAVTFWSTVDKWTIRFPGDGLRTGVGIDSSLTIPFDWKDQVRLSAGADYQFRSNLALRGGAYYDGTAAIDSTFSPNFPDVGSRIGLTAGFSYLLSPDWEFAAAQEVAFASQRTVSAVGSSDGKTTFPGTYSLTRLETIFSLSYRF